MKYVTTLLFLLLAACNHPPSAPPVIELPRNTSNTPPVAFRGPQVSIDLLKPNIELDLNWLDLEGFFPPGAERLVNSSYTLPDLVLPARVGFPSTDLAHSPDNESRLACDSLRPNNRLHHRLILENVNSNVPVVVYGTPQKFDVIWAPNSQRFAITTYLGGNRSDVLIIGTKGERLPVNIQEIVQANFPSHFWEAPLFVKAYRWTITSDLVVRCIGRSTVAPFDVFGCEIIVQFADQSNAVIFVRGYIKWSAAESSSALLSK